MQDVSQFKLPEKVVSKILAGALPEVLVSSQVKSAASRIGSIFILQLSIAAAEKAEMNNRRTLENQDIIKAVTELGLGEYAPQLVRFGAQRKRNAKRKESNIHKSKVKKPALDESAEHQDTSEHSDHEIVNNLSDQNTFQDEDDSQNDY